MVIIELSVYEKKNEKEMENGASCIVCSTK